MKKDVLIVYEKRSREIENACLLAVELEKMGYSVCIYNVLSLKRYFVKAKVVIAPHLYDNFQVVAIAKNFWCSNNAIIDLQYEQVLSAKTREHGVHNPKEQAINAYHIAWGNAQMEEYIKHGISPENVFVTGHMAMDLMSFKFNEYFLEKEDIATEFNLSINKRWILFISSFSYTNRTNDELAAYSRLNPDANRFAKISNISRDMIVNWIERASLEHPELIFIYRRHPAEINDERILKMEKHIENFRVISAYSMRQWIRSADVLYTWYSSSIIDAFFGKKNCLILRPCKLPYELDTDLMREAKHITSYNKFKHSLYDSSFKYPINEDLITYFYGGNINGFAFVKIASLCERMIKTRSHYKYDFGKVGLNILNSQNHKDAIQNLISRFIFDICRYLMLSKIYRLFFRKRSKTLEMFESENYQIDKEIKMYKTRLSKIIYTYDDSGF